MCEQFGIYICGRDEKIAGKLCLTDGLGRTGMGWDERNALKLCLEDGLFAHQNGLIGKIHSRHTDIQLLGQKGMNEITSMH